MAPNQSLTTGTPRPPSPPASRWRAVVAVALLCLGLAGCPIRSLEDRSAQAGPATPGAEKSADVLELVTPGIVIVTATLHLTSGSKQRRGSGFLVSESGHVLTSDSLIAPDGGADITARFVEVTLQPGTDAARTVSADVERANPELGVALLKVSAATPHYLRAVLADEVGNGAAAWIVGCASSLGLVVVEAAQVVGRPEGAGAPLLELSVPAEASRAGGPLVDAAGRVIGVLLPAQADSTAQRALGYGAVTAWLATDPADDPPLPRPGSAVLRLLEEAGLQNDQASDGVFGVPFDNGVNVLVHQSADYLRVYVPLGVFDPQTALRALAFGYYDPAGKLSVHARGDEDRLVWEAQAPVSVITAGYLKLLTRVGANQALRWREFLEGREPEDWYDLYPGGDKQQLHARLQAVLKVALGDEFEVDEESFSVTRGEVKVWLSVFRGMVWIRCYIGGMPGDSQQEQLLNAEDCLRRNWRDPLGRLSVDEYNDVSWEMQVPVELLTTELLEKTLADAELQVQAFTSRYGQVPFNENTDES